ncbi:Uncharacterized protein FWK35_00016699 [Aphis craccivora]|uniref:Transmembrane protein n=1 Tax=Aphis craccivora TaxID=307492 RepID=A0A6G0Y1R1_APHCR|nr:Uncharacterized protein FWK35_00016699 [Aphis craccivora]
MKSNIFYQVSLDYTINNIILQHVFEICDLGVTFDSTLLFNKYYLNITKKRTLEHNSVLWSPSSAFHILSLEAFQNRFLRFISYKCNIPRQPHSNYSPLLIELNMTNLADRRKIIDLKFLFKIVNSYLNCPELLSCLNFNVLHCRTRSANIFYISFQRTNYALIFVIILLIYKLFSQIIKLQIKMFMNQTSACDLDKILAYGFFNINLNLVTTVSVYLYHTTFCNFNHKKQCPTSMDYVENSKLFQRIVQNDNLYHVSSRINSHETHIKKPINITGLGLSPSQINSKNSNYDSSRQQAEKKNTQVPQSQHSN